MNAAKCETLRLCSKHLMLDIFEVVTGKTCTARPWQSCSRPDGTPLQAWREQAGRPPVSGTGCAVAS